MSKKLKITFIGAGSTVFSKNVIGDCLLTPALEAAEYYLFDIDETRLNESFQVISNINKTHGSKATIKKTLDRKEALRDASYVINAIQVGGYDPCTIQDFEIPKKFGLRHTIADTINVGGIMRALRTMKALREIAKDFREVCPKALFINYTNPMSMLTGYMNKVEKIQTIGLCHSVQSAVPELLKDLKIDIDPAKTKWYFAGINHMCFMLKCEDENGKDLYPLIKEKAKYYLDHKSEYVNSHPDLVRFYMMLTFGYYVAESSEHSSEYFPYFIKNTHPELIEEFRIPLDEYPRRCIDQIARWDKMRDELLASHDLKHERSHEYCSYIIEAMETDKIFEFWGNVINDGSIENLPADACVEIQCFAKSNGIAKAKVGRVPNICASLNRTHINVHEQVLEAFVTGEKQHIYNAALLDPHTSAVLSIEETKKMVDELLEAQKDWHISYK